MQLNESNDYVRQVAQETGVSFDYLNGLWNQAKEKVQTKKEANNPAYWESVISEFDKLVDNIDIEEARYIMTTREDYNRAANDFVNGLLSDDYSKADEHFGKMVNARLNLIINKKRDEFYKNVLADKAKKLVAGE